MWKHDGTPLVEERNHLMLCLYNIISDQWETLSIAAQHTCR